MNLPSSRNQEVIAPAEPSPLLADGVERCGCTGIRSRYRMRNPTSKAYEVEMVEDDEDDLVEVNIRA